MAADPFIPGIENFASNDFVQGPFSLIVPSDLGVTSGSELDGATVLVATGTEMELSVVDFFAQEGISYEPVPVEIYQTAARLFLGGAADVLVVPSSGVDADQLPSELIQLPDEISETQSTGNSDENIIGTSGDDKLNGDDGNDVLKGGKGNDTLDGGEGDDILKGGKGKDTLVGGVGNDQLEGGEGNDILKGGKGKDTLDGGEGNDVLKGGKGKDTLVGGVGNDQLEGGEGNDVLKGGKGKDTLDGGDGDDTLKGDKGKDTLDGGAGNDVLTGGEGADIFVFNLVGEKNKDVITDFDAENDTIQVSSADFEIKKKDGNVLIKYDGGETLIIEGESNKSAVSDSIVVVNGTDDTEDPAFRAPFLSYDLG